MRNSTVPVARSQTEVGASLTIRLLLLALLVPAAMAESASAQQPATSSYVEGEILVRFRKDSSERSRSSVRSSVAARSVRRFGLVEGLELLRLPPGRSMAEAIEDCEADPDVLYAEPNYRLWIVSHLPQTDPDPFFVSGDLWGLESIDAPLAWDHPNGTVGDPSVVVAVIDTGIDYNHPDIAPNMVRLESACNDNVDNDGNGIADDCFGINTTKSPTVIPDPFDDEGHGTHVAGTIGAKGNNGIGVVGVNWDVGLIACKFIEDNGFGDAAGAIDCLQYVKDLKDGGPGRPPVNIVATNNSWGGSEDSLALREAIAAHASSGILFVTAAGNGHPFFPIGLDNDTTPFFPCTIDLPNVLCTAATDFDEELAVYSNFGRYSVDIGAPGGDLFPEPGILSTVPGGGYQESIGTSMASPHVAGVAALLAAQDSSRTWFQIRNLILAGGDRIPATTDTTLSGNRLSAFGALNCFGKPATERTLLTRVHPVSNGVVGTVPGEPLTELSVLSIDCDAPGSAALSVVVDSTGRRIDLVDDGSEDLVAGDGIFSAPYVPADLAETKTTLFFPDGSSVKVRPRLEVQSIEPAQVDVAAPPVSLVVVGSSFDDTYDLPVANFYDDLGILLAQERAVQYTFDIPEVLVFPYPVGRNLEGGQLPGLRAGTVLVEVHNQLDAAAQSWELVGTIDLEVTGTAPAIGIDSIDPQSGVDLLSPPASFTMTGNGFDDFFGLPVANFYDAGGTLLAQSRAASLVYGVPQVLEIPFPGDQDIDGNPLPGLEAGTVTVTVFNPLDTSGIDWQTVGSIDIGVIDNSPEPVPSVDGIDPQDPVDLAAPPAFFTVTGSGFDDTFSLPTANFYDGTGALLAQSRADSLVAGTPEVLTIPFPGSSTPGLSAGLVRVEIYNQLDAGGLSWSLVGSIDINVVDNRSAPSVDSIDPQDPVDLAAPPAGFTVTGSGFEGVFALPVVMTLPFPGNLSIAGAPLPGLSAGSVRVEVYNQLDAGASTWSLVGSIDINVVGSGSGPSVDSIDPQDPVDLAAPPVAFTVTGSGFEGVFALPVANFYSASGQLLAQSRADSLASGTPEVITLPFPGNLSIAGAPLPGLAAGSVRVEIYNQLDAGGFSWSLVGSIDINVVDNRPAPSVDSIDPQDPVDLAAPPAGFTVTGSGFAGVFDLPVANFYSASGELLAQSRADSLASGTPEVLTLPFPGNLSIAGAPLPGLAAGSVRVEVYNQLDAGASSWSLVGSIDINVVDSSNPGVFSIDPQDPVDLAAPPRSFTITGSGFDDPFGLPVANFYNGAGVLVAQERATSLTVGTPQTLVVPFPDNRGLSQPFPGLSAGSVTVEIFNQLDATQSSWRLVGSIVINVVGAPPPPSLVGIDPQDPVVLSAPPPEFVIEGYGFDNSFDLPVANFYDAFGTVIAQERADSLVTGGPQILTVPFPDSSGFSGPMPGLSAGTVTVTVYNRLGSNSWSLVGSIAIEVVD